MCVVDRRRSADQTSTGLMPVGVFFLPETVKKSLKSRTVRVVPIPLGFVLRDDLCVRP